jgi:hypothetical protein
LDYGEGFGNNVKVIMECCSKQSLKGIFKERNICDKGRENEKV